MTYRAELELAKLRAAAPFSPTEVAELRQDFSAFAADRAIYLDTAATAQRPETVINAENKFLRENNAAVHRGTSAVVGAATLAFEGARDKVHKFVGAPSDATVVWSSNATDALNTLAGGFSEASLGVTSPALAVPGSDRFALDSDAEIVVTAAEHHANLIPWQRLAQRTGAKLVVVPVTPDGIWELDEFVARLNNRTRIVAFTHISNVTGWIAPVHEVVAATRKHANERAVIVLDACQSAPHIPINFTDLGVDFMTFSGHKLFAPYGIGALVGKTELLNALPPIRVGGSAITKVSLEHAEFLPAPHRFEPGTQPVSQAVGLGAAIDYLDSVDAGRAAATEHQLVTQLVEGIAGLNGVRLLGPSNPEQRVALTAVAVSGIHAHDIGQVLDTLGVMVRVGHHCAQPLHRELGITASVRASMHFTNTDTEVEQFIAGLKEAQRYFGGV
ncbi:aminotransferase class V-fold PLP-dependent enzyme [Canibacter zhoujuaniae]|uniref:aminotransferase class V-fold PLP-dependent enzyme n=1 Tax=Canibacter zhoujuaniae TaxID=2708343 RepID=UPI00141F2FA8|nr:aminotransferase class V-fold PLP-dependent enzyme [Canibacter zhoujuaniae]